MVVRLGRAALCAAMIAGASAPAAAIEEGEPIVDISGQWSGEGVVQRNDTSKPMKVRCSIAGQQDGEQLGFAGECRAMLIMKREIGADIVRENGRFTGTYKGSLAGIAQLDGAQNGDGELILEMTFPREVNGDDKATMTIRRPNEDELQVITVDRMVSGVDVTTSQIVFQRD